MAQFKHSIHNLDKTLIDHTDLVMLGNGITPPGTLIDAFGRLRTSEPFTLFESQHRYAENDSWSTSNTAGGKIFYHANSSAVRCVVGTASGASVIRETKRVFLYQSGKSLLILNSLVMATPKAGLRQRVGYFAANNGIFLESLGSNNYIVLRSQSSNIMTEQRIAQANWEFDSFDGTGYSTSILSGYTGLSIGTSNIFWIDLEWLGAGNVRCGFVLDGKFLLAHTFRNHGQLAAYMTTACLPCRAEITNVTATASQSVIQQICSAVISEGGYQARGTPHSSGQELNALKTLTTAATYYPVTSIRLAANRLDSLVLLAKFHFIGTTNNASYKYKILLNPSLTGASWTLDAHGTVELDMTASSFTGGTVVSSGYISSGVKGVAVPIDDIDAFRFQLGRTLAGISDIFTVVITSDLNSAPVGVIIEWTELL